ncbi:MAG: hypothetical protein K9J17_00350 [Flavobacteriales bacterium]|nr:hypothetical protein [Flavobacteriales bacterium]
MRATRFFSVVLFVAVSMTFNSCSKTNIGKLEGRWQLFWINDISDPNYYIWNFEGGELTILVYDPNSPLPQPTVGGRGQYKTTSEFLDAVVEISGITPSTMNPKVISQVSNGKWTIDKIDNDVMRLATTDQEGSGGSYVIREFSKAD